MKKASTYAIFALLVCAVPWMSQALEVRQPCKKMFNGQQSGNNVTDTGLVPMDQGPVVRLYVSVPENVNVVGSYLMFCDDQDFKMKLADDRKSYIVNRKDDSSNPSFHKIIVYYSGDEPEPRNKNRLLRNKRPAAKENLRGRRRP